LTGAAGLVLGLLYPLIGVLAAAGLSVLMMAGFLTRIKLKDNFLQTLPSFFFVVVNVYITSAYCMLLGFKGE
jgi:hypothetical protein